MAAAIARAAFGLLPAAISFAVGVLASMALRTVPPRSVYELESTGAAGVLDNFLLESIAQGNAIVGLALTWWSR